APRVPPCPTRRSSDLVTDQEKLTYDLADVPLKSLVRGTLLLSGEHPDAVALASTACAPGGFPRPPSAHAPALVTHSRSVPRTSSSEEHTSELQSLTNL